MKYGLFLGGWHFEVLTQGMDRPLIFLPIILYLVNALPGAPVDSLLALMGPIEVIFKGQLCGLP